MLQPPYRPNAVVETPLEASWDGGSGRVGGNAKMA